MKKESNTGLFFLLAVGIVGLGLYYGATQDYSSGEIQLYHMICWVILIIALLRVLELVWEPIRSLWDQSWGKAQDKQNVCRNERAKDNAEASFMREDSSGRTYSSQYEGMQAFPAADKNSVESGGPIRHQEENISRPEDVIIMPDRGARFYLGDGSLENGYEGSAASPDSRITENIPYGNASFAANKENSVLSDRKTDKKDEIIPGKKKDKKDKKKKKK